MRKFTKVLALLLWIQLLCALSAWSQTGREFWFVAPEVTSDHKPAYPVVLRITALDQSANVVVSMPANSSFTPISFSVGANKQYSITSDIGSFTIETLENKPANSILNKGLLITSDADITVYYEVASTNNPDKFALKGENALGMEFYIPSQDEFQNHSFSIQAKEHVDIVATEDNTQISITPTTAIVGHAANVPYTITLNRGETYSLEAVGTNSTTSLKGTYISSDKNIAVTISDDSIDGNNTSPGHWDLIGDQLIPTTILGLEYIAVRSNTNAGTPQKVYILATENNTYVNIANDPTKSRYLQKGEQFSLDIVNNATYIKADKPIYAYEVTGLVEEMGSAILPPITCTGSTSVSFTRVLTNAFWIQILVQGKNRNSFEIRDDAGAIVPGINISTLNWEEVVGTSADADEKWYSAIVNATTLTTGKNYTVSNSTGLFHLGILESYGSASTSFGYFSAYSTLQVSGIQEKCKGETIQLSATNDMKSYQWFSKATGNTILGTASTLDVTQSGKYWVEAEVKFGGCVKADTLDVTFTFPDFSLKKDTLICPEATLKVDGPTGYPTYLWSDGTTGSSTNVTVLPNETKNIWLKVTDADGCSKTDDMNVTGRPAATVNIGAATESTCNKPLVITNATPMNNYQWQVNGVNVAGAAGKTKSYTADLPGTNTYTVTGYNAEGCLATATKTVTINPLPVVTMNDVVECKRTPSSPFTGPSGMTAYKWTDVSNSAVVGNSQTITLPDSATYRLEVTDANGCVNSDDFIYSWHVQADVVVGDPIKICPNINYTIEANSSLTNFSWDFENISGTVTHLNNDNFSYLQITNSDNDTHGGFYTVTAEDSKGCTLTERVPFFVDDVPTIPLEDVSFCDGESYMASIASNFYNIQWTANYANGTSHPNLSNADVIQIQQAGIYTVTGDVDAAVAGTCQASKSFNVNVYAIPTFTLGAPLAVCYGESFSLSPQNLSSGNGLSNVQYQWNTGDVTRTFTSTTPGEYTLTVLDNMMCSSTQSVVVTNQSVATPVAALVDADICDNLTYTLTAPANLLPQVTSYQWTGTDFNGAALSSPSPNVPWTVNTGGDYFLTYTDNLGLGCDTTLSMRLTTRKAPVFDLGNNQSVCGGDTLFVAVDPSFTSYMWNGNPLDNQPYKVVNGTQTLTLQIGNDKGCTATDNITMTALPQPVVNIPDQTVCSGVMATLTASGFSSVKWSTGETTPSIQVTKGTYEVEVTDANNCKNKDVAAVSWRPIPNADLGEDVVICPVETADLTAPTGPAPLGYSYLWNTGATSQSITVNLNGTYEVSVTDLNNNCVGYDNITVWFPIPQPYELAPIDPVCDNQKAGLDAGDGYLSYEWSDGSTNQVDSVTVAGDYISRVFDGCHYLQDTVTVTFVPTPVINALDTMVYSQVVVDASGGTAPLQYALNQGNYQDENIFVKVENGTHLIEVVDANNCIADTTFTLNSNIEVTVPNFFTPNGDGWNDTWKIDGLQRFPEACIKIYDRYGKLLILMKPDDNGWDGTYMNKPVTSDDYWYVVELLPTSKLIKGHFTVKR